MFGNRFKMSCYSFAGMWNLVCKAVGVNDPAKLISPKTVWNLKQKIGKVKLQEHNEKCVNLLEIDFDGTTTTEALPHNKTKETHFLGITDGLGKYINHEKSEKTGKAMSEVVIRNIYETKSEKSLLVTGSGM